MSKKELMQNYALLDWVPLVDNFLYLWAVSTGSFVVSIIGILHPALVTMYVHRDRHEKLMANIGGILSSSLSIASFILLIGLFLKYPLLCAAYFWYIVAFVCTCLLVMAITGVRLSLHREWKISMLACAMMPLVLFAFLAYGAIVVNSYRVEFTNGTHVGSTSGTG